MFLGCAPFHVSPLLYVVQKFATLFPLRCLVFGLGVVGVALLVFCLVAVGFVFFCCVFLPGGIVAFWMKLQRLRMVEQ